MSYQHMPAKGYHPFFSPVVNARPYPGLSQPWQVAKSKVSIWEMCELPFMSLAVNLRDDVCLIHFASYIHHLSAVSWKHEHIFREQMTSNNN